MTAYKSTESLQSALRLGAVDYLDKPFNNDVLKKKVREALEQRRLRAYAIVGDSPQMQRLKDRIKRVAPTNSTVLIIGESGRSLWPA